MRCLKYKIIHKIICNQFKKMYHIQKILKKRNTYMIPNNVTGLENKNLTPINYMCRFTPDRNL